MGNVKKKCVDCVVEGVTTKRKVTPPGPRCDTHHRARKKQRKSQSFARRLEETYNITEEQYWEIYEYQGRRCYNCPNKGTYKRLSVDHDHACCPGRTSCGKCVRGLLCQPCNRYLGHIRDNPEALLNGVEYLNDPPARKVLKWDT
ncbi:hypothetical protein IL38_06945 [Actinopolyspora erythraea]|uniref:Endonuclease VII n=1 Tax=Actinopolyspora erythraea TaxID=414996 RepID=A0ABR4X5Q5_9ACTN|nr:hypothetical protein IL38_06945 [Actinopolyspora erythraea]